MVNVAVLCPHTFSFGSDNYYIVITPSPHHEIYPQSLSRQYLIARGSKRQKKSGWNYSSFTKGETFLVS